MLINERGTQRQVRATLSHRLNPLVDVQLHIATRDPQVVVCPIATLLTGDSLQLNSFDGLIDHAATKQRVIDT